MAEWENGEFFEALVHSTAEKSGKSERQVGQDCANIMITDLFGVLNTEGLSIDQSPIDHGALAGLQALKLDGTISGRIAKDVFAEMLETGKQAADIVEEKGLRQVSRGSCPGPRGSRSRPWVAARGSSGLLLRGQRPSGHRSRGGGAVDARRPSARTKLISSVQHSSATPISGVQRSTTQSLSLTLRSRP